MRGYKVSVENLVYSWFKFVQVIFIHKIKHISVLRHTGWNFDILWTERSRYFRSRGSGCPEKSKVDPKSIRSVQRTHACNKAANPLWSLLKFLPKDPCSNLKKSCLFYRIDQIENQQLYFWYFLIENLVH